MVRPPRPRVASRTQAAASLATPGPLVRHVERVAEELHQRCGGSADPRVLVDESGGDDVVLGQLRPAEEVLAFQVVGERMLGVRPGRDALE